MAQYFKSKVVKVYPSAFRGSVEKSGKTFVYDPESRLTTEENLIRVYKLLSDFTSFSSSQDDAAASASARGSFVVSDVYDGSSHKSFEFVLAGYYFYIKDASSVFVPTEEAGEIRYYAKIVSINRAGSIDADTDNIEYTSKTLGNTASEQITTNALDVNDWTTASSPADDYFVGLEIDSNLSSFDTTDNYLFLMRVVRDSSQKVAYNIPETSKIKFDKRSLFGGVDRQGHDRALHNLLETGSIGFTDELYSEATDNRNTNNIKLNAVNGSIKGYALTNKDGKNRGNLLITTTSDGSGDAFSESQQKCIKILSSSDFDTVAGGSNTMQATKSINIEAGQGIKLDGSKGTSGVAATQNFKLPLKLEGEPGTPPYTHILASREWITTNDIQFNGKDVFTSTFRLKRADNNENEFVYTPSTTGTDATTGKLELKGNVGFYTYNGNDLKFSVVDGKVQIKNIGTPYSSTSKTWTNSNASLWTTGGVYVDKEIYSGLGIKSNSWIQADGMILAKYPEDAVFDRDAKPSLGSILAYGGIAASKKIVSHTNLIAHSSADSLSGAAIQATAGGLYIHKSGAFGEDIELGSTRTWDSTEGKYKVTSATGSKLIFGGNYNDNTPDVFLGEGNIKFSSDDAYAKRKPTFEKTSTYDNYLSIYAKAGINISAGTNESNSGDIVLKTYTCTTTIKNDGLLVSGPIKAYGGSVILNWKEVKIGNIEIYGDNKITNTSGNIEYSSGDMALKASTSTNTVYVYPRLEVKGNIKATGSIEGDSFNATSDKRLKTNIEEFIPEKSILDLPIKQFDFKSDKSHHIGCIAQDLQEICPEIVHEDKDGYLSIEESKIVYLLIDELKKTNARVKELEKKLEKFEK